MIAATFRNLTKHTGGTFAPILGDVHIYHTEGGSRAQVSNGRYWVDAPCGTAPEMTVNAERLAAVLTACQGEPTVSVTETGVVVKDGKVRARLAQASGVYPKMQPDPPDDTALPEIMPILKALQPFAATDASRPWSMCVCLSGGYAYATNNVCVARHPLPHPVTTAVNIPSTVIDAVSERGEIQTIGYSGASVTFYYTDGSWVRTLLVSGEWPTKTVDGMLDDMADQWQQVHPDLSSMLTTAAKMANDKYPCVRFHDDGFSLTDDTFTVSEMAPVPEGGAVAAKMAATVFNIATHVQWHTPRQDAHAFLCGELTGVFAGVRQ
jgi:hypothetical protein